MMEEYFNTLLQETERRMAAAAAGMEGKETVATCREMVSYLKAKNRELKAYALARPFSGNEEEIRYFKYYKPALTGRLLYYYRVYQIESGCPACLRVAEPYYRKAMERAERMMERYLPFYQYYHSGATYRDDYYFLRAKGELSPESGSFVLDEEAEFSTGYDILAARLISVEMLLVHLSRRIERAARGDGTEAVPEKEHRWTNTKVAAIQRLWHTRDGKRGRGQRRDRRAGCAVREAFPRGSGQRVPRFRQAAGATEPDGVLGRDEGEAAEKDAGHGQQVIGKSAASWQQVGNGAAEAAGDEKRSSGGQKRAFRTLSFCSFCFDVSSFPPCFYVIPTLSLPFSVFSAFLLPGKADGRAARVKKEDGKMRIRKKSLPRC